MTDIKDKSSINSDENTLKFLWQTVLEQEKEARWRYPDFLPIFKLRESYQGIEYSIEFSGQGEKAWELEKYIKQIALKGFPIHTEWKPIEMLPTNLGTELDLIFNRFPNQSYLETEVTHLVQQAKCGFSLNKFSSLLTTMAYIFTPTIVVMYFIISGQSNFSRLFTRSPEITIKSTKQPDRVSCASSKCDRQILTYLIKGKNGEVITVNIERVAKQ